MPRRRYRSHDGARGGRAPVTGLVSGGLMTSTEISPRLRARRKAVALIALSLSMSSFAFVVDGTAASVLRVLSLVPLVVAMAFPGTLALHRGMSSRRRAVVVVVGVLVAFALGALAYLLTDATSEPGQEDGSALGVGQAAP